MLQITQFCMLSGGSKLIGRVLTMFFWGELPPKNAGCNDAFDHGSDYYLRIASLLRYRFVLRRISMVSLGNRYNESSRSGRSYHFYEEQYHGRVICERYYEGHGASVVKLISFHIYRGRGLSVQT